MIIQRTSYRSQTYNAWKAFSFAFPAFILGVVIAIVIARYLKRPLIGVFGGIGVSTIPFLFQKRFKKLFTKDVLLVFDDQSFSVKEYKLSSDALIKETEMNWSAIRSYKCYFSDSGISTLVVYLRSGSSYTYALKEDMNQEQAVNEKSAFSIFHYFVSQYNVGKHPEEEIFISPGFLTTKKGSFLLYSVVALAITAIATHFILNPSTSIFSIVMSVFIIIGLFVKRKTDNDFYKKISQLEPRVPVD